MNFFLYKLISPNTTQMRDSELSEDQIMENHAEYWGEQMEKGKVAAFGPVADPNGSYSIAILCLPDDEDPSTVVSGDPALTSLAGFKYDIFMMPGAIAKGT